MEDEKFFSTKEAAAFLGVSDRTIQNYRKDGILVPDQFGKNNSVFYSKKQLVEVVKRLISSGETLPASGDTFGKKSQSLGAKKPRKAPKKSVNPSELYQLKN